MKNMLFNKAENNFKMAVKTWIVQEKEGSMEKNNPVV